MSRAQRRFNTEKYLNKQRRLAKYFGDWYRNIVCGKNRKKHFMDCGRSHCAICAKESYKRMPQYRRTEENLKDGISESI